MKARPNKSVEISKCSKRLSEVGFEPTPSHEDQNLRHFLPEEDDKFLERVRAVVEEEKHRAMAAAEIDAAKGAIATAGESREAIQSGGLHSKVQVMIKME
ncbi:hypothetical protein POTOM_010533 [Populus tomentosa]|uniref:Uncharacterized protein n=1 Tax=Populus tomentosa TaxID=118781 RepID=A0A8X8DAE7_POPTO|nr:hypothetical protein POTOM_010533 [Populus tomentosa]